MTYFYYNIHYYNIHLYYKSILTLARLGRLCLNKQLIYNTPTRNEHILDLILTNVSKYYKVPTM